MDGLPPFARTHANGITLAIKVQPRARKSAVGPVRGGELVVRVTAPPVDAKANEAMIALLASTLGLPASRLEIVRGHMSRSKVVLARSCSVEQVSRLQECLRQARPEQTLGFCL